MKRIIALWPQGVREICERAPMAVPHPRGNKVIWASDWGKGSGSIYAYVAQMPSQ